MAPVEAKSTKVPCVCVCVELLFGGSITFDEDRPFPIRITSTVQSFYANKTLRATNEKKKTNNNKVSGATKRNNKLFLALVDTCKCFFSLPF